MNRAILMALSLIISHANSTAAASVTVTVNQKQYEFLHEPRLVEVFATITNKKNVYWPGAVIYQAENSQLEETRQLVLNRLATITQRYLIEEPETARSLKQLQTTIGSWRLARRLPIKIDYDLARMIAAANPRLPKGNYILNLAPRMDTIELFGAINKAGNIPHKAHADASEYITRESLTHVANKDYVMLIMADGREITAPVAYWNKNHQEVMPGSQIFIPFKTSLFQPEFAIINQQITTLALNRLR